MNSSTKTIFVAALATFAALAVFGILAQGASATTITVNAAGGADHTTIQDALNASVDGDTISVYDGTYVETLYIQTNATRLSAASGQHPVIQGLGDSSTPAIAVYGAAANISGFVIESEYGACISLTGGANDACVVGNTFRGNYSSVIVETNRSLFFGNIVGTGIYIQSGSNDTIQANNFSARGIQVFVPDCSISDNTFLDSNPAVTVNIDGARASIVHNIFQNASIIVQQAEDCTVSYNNITSLDAAGIRSSGPGSIIEHNEITGRMFSMYLETADMEVRYNAMFWGGVRLSGPETVPSMSSNTIDGKQLFCMFDTAVTGPFYNASTMAQVILVNVSGISLTGGDFLYPMTMYRCANISVINCTFVNWTSAQKDDVYAIKLKYVNSSLFSSNTITGFGVLGISMELSENNTVVGNNISLINCNQAGGGGWALWIYLSSNNTVRNNTFSQCRIGVGINVASHNNNITSNNIYGNTASGMYFRSAWYDQSIGNTAINNWWGAASGPYNATDNPSGTGNNFTTHEYSEIPDMPPYSPWLSSPVVVAAAAAPETPVTPAANHAPAISNFSANITTVNPGWTVNLSVLATDPDGDALEYYYTVNGTTMFALSVFPCAAPDWPGTYLITANVTDGTLYALAWLNITVANGTVTPPPGNRAPAIAYVTANATAVNPADLFEINVSAADADGDALTYQYISHDGISVPSTGPVSTAVLVAPATPGIYEIEIIVSDGTLSAQSSINITVVNNTASPGNRAPAITSVSASPPAIGWGNQAAITVSAADPDGNTTLTYAYSVTGGTISGTGASVTWTAPQANGTYTITVTVSDGSLNAVRTVTIDVTGQAGASNQTATNQTQASTPAKGFLPGFDLAAMLGIICAAASVSAVLRKRKQK